MTKTTKLKQVLLSVLAHPDDESFGMGGTLALYASRGVEVHLICATRGEVGEVGPEHLKNHKSIADLRVAELRCAAGHLGITGVHLLDYRDSGMTGSKENGHPNALAAAPVGDVARKVANIMREVKPDVVLTFDPIGGYRHPDHIAAHNATVQAFDMADDPSFDDGQERFKPAKLYFHTFSRRYVRYWMWILRLTGKDPSKWGKNQDIDLLSIASVNYPTHAKINYATVNDRKMTAAACHASQGGGVHSGGLMRKLFMLFEGKHVETFMRAYPAPTKNTMESDLFEGI